MPIKIENLFYYYFKKTPNEVEALNDVSLMIKDHSFSAFIGSTGSGKSTLMQNLNALLIPYSGDVQVDEFHIGNNKRKNKNIKQLRKHLGLVFQFPEYQLFEETVEKDVAFGLKNYGYKEDEALKIARETLLQVGIKEEYFTRSPFELSGGEKRRVAIAGILALSPDILVLDEPTAGLSNSAKRSLMSLLKQMHKDGKTIILVTHDMDLVLSYCDSVYLLHDGKLIFNGSPFEMFKTIDNDYGIEVPPLYKLVKILIDKGMDIDISKIHSLDDLFKVIS